MATDTTTSRQNWWSIGLWVVQVVLAAFFGLAGFMKLIVPMQELAAQMAWAGDSPALLVRFIGIAEITGAIGVILPAATRILPWLTPLAALGFALIQVLAMGLHVSRREFVVLPMNLVLLALSLLVAWGRWRKAPIVPRT